ncbi:Glyoxylate reductase [Tolypocladium ophioglossoides CBS 100239]|uniref:Glyoxylate reductase n=1 Tax=Tolypocladium ophioglossoides (strain CBS 100239) TaxID=1163406 RepID=A0A0L0MX41_TOLOC|nr:Glyoxylate reductase [Tolypocladium ophioglossoides CBS 100239]
MSDSSSNDWKTSRSLSHTLKDAQGQPPHTCGNEIAGFSGFGTICQRIARLFEALGMTVLAATSDSTNNTEGRQRTAFREVSQRATVIFIAVPRTPQTRNLIEAKQCQAMRPTTVLVNVGRGGTVDETAILQALREGRAATNVFQYEPAGSSEDSVPLSPEVKHLKLTLMPSLVN